jgi:hypothetical protein
MWFASLAFFSCKDIELTMLTRHLDLATIERSQIPPIFTASDAGKHFAFKF